MKQVLRVFCALLVLGASTSVFAMCSFRLVKKPNGHHVFILGDCHTGDIDYFKPNMKLFIDVIEAAQFSEPLPITIEFDKLDLDVSVEIAESITCLIKKWGKENSKASLSYFDPRGTYSSFLEEARQVLFEIVLVCVSHEELNAYPKVPEWKSEHMKALNEQKEKYKPIFNKQIRQKTECSVGGFLEELEGTANKLKALVEKYQHRPDVHAQISAIHERYFEAMGTIKVQLSKCNSKQAELPVELLKLCLASESIDELLSFFSQFNKLYCVDTDYAYFDACLLDRALSREEVTTPECYIVGETHAENFFNMLCKVQNWKKLFEPVTMVERLSTFSAIRLEFPEFPKCLEHATRVIIKPLLVSCQVCEKVGDIKACGACQELLYCSVACQRAGWKEHKMVCKKVKVRN